MLTFQLFLLTQGFKEIPPCPQYLRYNSSHISASGTAGSTTSTTSKSLLTDTLCLVVSHSSCSSQVCQELLPEQALTVHPLVSVSVIPPGMALEPYALGDHSGQTPELPAAALDGVGTASATAGVGAGAEAGDEAVPAAGVVPRPLLPPPPAAAGTGGAVAVAAGPPAVGVRVAVASGFAAAAGGGGDVGADDKMLLCCNCLAIRRLPSALCRSSPVDRLGIGSWFSTWCLCCFWLKACLGRWAVEQDDTGMAAPCLKLKLVLALMGRKGARKEPAKQQPTCKALTSWIMWLTARCLRQIELVNSARVPISLSCIQTAAITGVLIS